MVVCVLQLSVFYNDIRYSSKFDERAAQECSER